MLENWESFSSTLISDPFLDDAEKFKDDFESTNTDFCDSLSSEPLSSKSSVTSKDRIYSYSMEDSDSLDDRATSTSTLNSIYNINPLDDNDVFSSDLSLFDETPSSTNTFNSTWTSKSGINEIAKVAQNASTEEITKSNIQQAASVNTASINSVPKIIRITEPSHTMLQPISLQPEAKILKMTVVSSATPVHEAIKAAGIGLYSTTTQFKTVKVVKQPQQQLPTRIVVIKKPLTTAATTTTTTYVPFRNGSNSISRTSRIFRTQRFHQSYNEWESDMPVLTREAPFRPEQLSYSTRRIFPSTSSSARPYQIYECPKCSKNLPNKHALAKHLHIHEPPRYKCSQCDRMFYDRTKLRRHQIVHSAEKRYECGICASKFALEQNLRVHMRIHQNFIPFAHLKNHVNVHSQKATKKLPSILRASIQ